MLYQGIIGGGSSPVEPEDLSPVLLWTNPSPTSTFEGQTVSLDLAEYAGVIIEFNQDNSTHQTLVSRLYCKKADNYGDLIGAGFVASGGATYARDVVKVDNNGVQFGSSYNNNAINVQGAIIPIKIYGVKEYVVEPVVGDLLWTNPSTTTAFTPQKISVDLSNAKGAAIEVMVSTTTQIVCSRQLVYKGDKNIGLGYSAGGVAQTRNIDSVEDDGITFETGYSANTASTDILIPYKIYSIN